MKAEELVKEIAESDPIESDDEVNYCKFCNEVWPESHNEDCFWRRANEIMKGGD